MHFLLGVKRYHLLLTPLYHVHHFRIHLRIHLTQLVHVIDIQSILAPNWKSCKSKIPPAWLAMGSGTKSEVLWRNMSIIIKYRLNIFTFYNCWIKPKIYSLKILWRNHSGGLLSEFKFFKLFNNPDKKRNQKSTKS